MPDIKINFREETYSIEFVLQQLYFSEFKVIDGCNRHPQRCNFYEWLFIHRLITESEKNRINDIIKEEYSDEE